MSLTWAECLEMKGRWEGKENKEEKEQSTKVALSNLGCWSELYVELTLERKKQPVEEASASFWAESWYAGGRPAYGRKSFVTILHFYSAAAQRNSVTTSSIQLKAAPGDSGNPIHSSSVCNNQTSKHCKRSFIESTIICIYVTANIS